MTSSNGNIFSVTGHLCGEFTGHRWIPHTKASDAELWCFLRSAINGWVNNGEAGDLRRHRAHYDLMYLVLAPKSSIMHVRFRNSHRVMQQTLYSMKYAHRFVSRGQVLPSDIVVACVCQSVRPSVTKFVRTITHYPFKLGSPNLDHRCKRPWLRSLLFLGLIDLDLQC